MSIDSIPTSQARAEVAMPQRTSTMWHQGQEVAGRMEHLVKTSQLDSPAVMRDSLNSRAVSPKLLFIVYAMRNWAATAVRRMENKSNLIA